MTNLYTLSSVSRTLDRERQRLHEIRVEAFDLGVPTSLSSDLDITVYVSDVNDNKYGHQLHFHYALFYGKIKRHRKPKHSASSDHTWITTGRSSSWTSWNSISLSIEALGLKKGWLFQQWTWMRLGNFTVTSSTQLGLLRKLFASRPVSVTS